MSLWLPHSTLMSQDQACHLLQDLMLQVQFTSLIIFNCNHIFSLFKLQIAKLWQQNMKVYLLGYAVGVAAYPGD